MPVLPDKFSLRGTAVPDGQRPIANISYDSPLYAAGEKFGNAITGLGQKLRTPEKKVEPGAEVKAIDAMAQANAAAVQGFDQSSANPDQAYEAAKEQLEKTNAGIKAGLSPDELPHVGIGIDVVKDVTLKNLSDKRDARNRDLRIAEVEGLFPSLTARHAALSDPTARQEIGAALFGSIDKLREAGDIDEDRAQAMKLDLQRQLVRADVQAQPAAWQMEKLQPGPDGKTNFFIDTLGGEDAEYLRAHAGLRDKADKRDGATQSLLDRFGTAPENEAKALAEISDKHGDDPGLRRLYLGRLQMQRRQERREIAQSAGNFYALAREGRLDEIDPADARRLHKAGQMEGLLEAAQYGRNAEAPGDLLFRERYLAMGEDERARFKPAELAQKLAPQDFLEVMQGTSGDIDEGQRSRMQGFVQAVKPILGAVTLGEYATPQEQERDRRLLGLIRDEVRIQTADQEKKKGRDLSAWEYENLMRDAVGISLLRHERSELERRGMA
ncbi:MAG: hypothetical protein AB7G04_11775, partial [Hyphomonadaceae bacterium]